MGSVDERVQRAVEHWGLHSLEVLIGGSRSCVFAARNARGEHVVLKFPAARANGSVATSAEAAALRSWAGTGAAITVLDSTDDALLLERARPGAGWPWGQQETAAGTMIDVAAEVLGRLWSASPTTLALSSVAEAYPGHERRALEDAAAERRHRGEPDRGRRGVGLLPDARAAVDDLCDTTRESTLLHGDFVTKNLVSHSAGRVGWVVVDPLPVWGDPCVDVATFAAYQPAESIMQVAESLAGRTGLDPRRCLRWTAVWAVHQAAQGWRDDHAEVESLIGSSVVRDLLRSDRPPRATVSSR